MKKNLRKRNAGFTLIELVVVVLIIGILGAIMIPGYTKSVESSKADDAAGVVTMIGQANRMFRVDNNSYVVNGTMSDSCNSTACSAGSAATCQLVACNYLGSRKWNSLNVESPGGLPYTYQVGTSVNCGIPGATNGIACGKRVQSANGGYDHWGYVMAADGIVTAFPDCNTPSANPPPCPRN
jgi:prepilin-type N-terminal cleavage/methylation domain-containing protein